MVEQKTKQKKEKRVSLVYIKHFLNKINLKLIYLIKRQINKFYV